MGYNTRRKSLSLPSLGIALPGNGARSNAHRSTPTIKEEPSFDETSQPPAKRAKRSHTLSSTTPPPSVILSRQSSLKHEAEHTTSRVAQHTPPPSPGPNGGFKIDTQGIDDDIVVGVIEQLEKTGNRPHLLKELAAVLSTQLQVVESSANPSAIISSRLSTYLRRPWSALSPCPVGKELIGTHPKRLYFFLTNQPHQDFPEPTDMTIINKAAANRIISPSISSAADDDDIDTRRREELSPSPEVDLSNPEFDADEMQDDGFGSGSDAPSLTMSSNLSHRHTETPPLERDEREFTQTVTSLQARSRSQSMYGISEMVVESKPEIPTITEDSLHAAIQPHEEPEDLAAQKNIETATALFGHTHASKHLGISTMDFASSPMMKPSLGIDAVAANKFDELDVPMFSAGPDSWSWNELKSPEAVGLDELDDMFAGY